MSAESVEEAVRALPEAWRERWVERAGFLLDAGRSPADADRIALYWTLRAMRAAAEQEAA